MLSMDAPHSASLAFRGNVDVSDWLSAGSGSKSPSPVPVGRGPGGLFNQENDSVETITMDNHRRVSTSNVTVAGGNTPNGKDCAAGGLRPAAADDISKCISNLSLYDLLNNTNPSSCENSGSDTSDGSEPEHEAGDSCDRRPHHDSAAAVLKHTAQNLRPTMRKLKSSLKLSSSSSQSSISSSKSVRFASELTRVKRFDSSREPATISNETSPQVSPIEHHPPDSQGSSSSTSYASNIAAGLDPSDSFWFGTQLSKMNLPLSKSIPKFSLSDSDNELDDSDSDFDLDYLNHRLQSNHNYSAPNYSKTISNMSNPSSSSNSNTYSQRGFKFKVANTNNSNANYAANELVTGLDTSSNTFNMDNTKSTCANQFDFNFNASPTKDPIQVKSWILKDTNIKKFYPASLNIDQDLSNYLQGNNIKLHECNSLQLSQGKLTGLIYVNNLSFEKFIEIKFSFNDWKDIHYVTATYKRTITNTVDEFQFIINLSSFVYFLRVKNLIQFNSMISPLTIHLCCRYDVNGETYYDNNNYENYQVSLDAVTNIRQKSKKKSNRHRLLKSSSSSLMKRSLSSDNVSTELNTVSNSLAPSIPSSGTGSRPKLGRRFSEDTDFFQHSPLKNGSKNYTTSPLNQADPKYDELIRSYCFYDPNASSRSKSPSDVTDLSTASTSNDTKSFDKNDDSGFNQSILKLDSDTREPVH